MKDIIQLKEEIKNQRRTKIPDKKKLSALEKKLKSLKQRMDTVPFHVHVCPPVLCGNVLVFNIQNTPEEKYGMLVSSLSLLPTTNISKVHHLLHQTK